MLVSISWNLLLSFSLKFNVHWSLNYNNNLYCYAHLQEMAYSENCDFARYTKIGAHKCKGNYGNMLIFRKILCSCVNIFLLFLLTTIICYLPSCTFVVYIFKCMHCLGCCCFFVFFFCFCLFVCLFWGFFCFFSYL